MWNDKVFKLNVLSGGQMIDNYYRCIDEEFKPNI